MQKNRFHFWQKILDNRQKLYTVFRFIFIFVIIILKGYGFAVKLIKTLPDYKHKLTINDILKIKEQTHSLSFFVFLKFIITIIYMDKYPFLLGKKNQESTTDIPYKYCSYHS